MQSKFKRGAAALAVASALGAMSAGAQAQSSVTLYGLVDAWAGMTKNLGASDRAAVVNSGGMSTSYWGMKGNEDLGNGLKAIFALEAFFRPDTGKAGRFDGDTFFARNANVGLSSNTWGTIKLGRITPPYFVSTILFNPYGDSYTFSPMVFHTYLGNGLTGPGGISGLVGDSGWNNSILYSTPDFNGLTGNFIYGAGEQAGHNGQNKWGGNFLYFHGNFAATAAFQQVRFDSKPGDLNSLVAGFQRQSAAQLGATYDFGVVKLYGQYQYIKNTIATGDAKSNGGQLGASIPLGAGSILASYAYTKTSGAADVKRNTWAIGYDYSLSKRTDVYAAYFRDKVSTLSSADTFGVGIRAKF
ncbi:gram-negative porin family protein [Ralstonia insidiosa]|uniref:Gram-negative porin family protein n=1 Tax=Ralstonia insidiosa TaxID=190721 RepID=A0AAC9BGW0_9RALS|nr:MULTISPECIES: porin [Ralstonia]ANH72363.1 gram-negative porin family protein [Ralstonia insidiosa]EPX97456.1 porin [Ralstonia sp. AU12-08]MBY4703631.1 porin [Ralstonia insidiosa]GAQ31386.1 porin [Ralstonia sp. NT80]